MTITPLSLLLVQLASPEPVPGLLTARLIETLIGVLVGSMTAAATAKLGGSR